MAESVYSCSYCGTTMTDGTPNQGGCSAKSSYVIIGKIGRKLSNNNYQCKDCKIVVKTNQLKVQTLV
jgi:hypothetical protein